MSKKSSDSKRKAVLDEIAALKAKRRASIIKCAFAIMAVVLAIAAKSMLETIGFIGDGNRAASGVLFLTAVVLAAFAGFASTDYAKSGRRIEELCARYSITKDEISAYERA